MSIESLYTHFLQSTGVNTDTRKIGKGNVFFALKGPNFNANDFAPKALEAGASLVVVDEDRVIPEGDPRYFLVDDALVALQKLANHHRHQLHIPIIGLTGSNGKTTSKELLHAVLKQKFKTSATVGNLNNHIGVPLTLLAITPDTEIAIVEMGANKQGDIKELCDIPSNYRSTESLDAYLKRNGVIGIQGIDTRAIVRQIRTQGAMKGILSTTDLDDASLVRKAQESADIVGQDLVREVMNADSCEWVESLQELGRPTSFHSFADRTDGPHVVAIDYGMKLNIPRYLRDAGCRVTIVPGTSAAEEILALNPDGVFLSNGPGDPEPLTYAIDTIRGLLGKKPIFGICLGLQLLGLAFGGKTFKLRFGHRGANQPVLNKRTGQVEITSQNHGFAVDPDSLPADVEVTHINLNDNTVEGIRHAVHSAFGVQYHPEAAAGPHDSHYLFTEFVDMMQAAAV